MRDTMIFYRSFYEAIKELPPENKIEVYDAIFSYSLDFSEPDLSGISKTIFTLIKPQLDANIKRFENGKKPKQKQNEANEANASIGKQNEHDNDNDNDNDIKIRVINNSFVSIENFDDCVQDFQGNKKYFFIAYLFWELWYKENPNSKTMKEAKVGKWVDDVRKIVEIDKTSIERLIGIYCYFTKCTKQEIGFDDFWYKTVKSMAAFRNKNKAGVYYIDQIIDKVNDKRDKDQDFLRMVDGAINKFNNNQKLK